MKLSQSSVGMTGAKPSTRFLGPTHSVTFPALSVTLTRAKSPKFDCIEMSANESDGHEYVAVGLGTPLCASEMDTVKLLAQGDQCQPRNVTSCPGVQVWLENPVVEIVQFPQVGGVVSIRKVGDTHVFSFPLLLSKTSHVPLSEFTMQEESPIEVVAPLLLVYFPHLWVNVTVDFDHIESPSSYVPGLPLAVQYPQSIPAQLAV